MTAESFPVFPLNSVLFPNGLLPLRIFEPRYLDMVSRCLRDDTGFIVALIQEGDEVGGNAAVYSTGTLAKITDWDAMTDGLLGITVAGQKKVILESCEIGKDKLMTAVVKPVKAEPVRAIPPEFESLVKLLEKILQQIGAPFDTIETHLDDSAWVAGRLVEFVPVPLESKQKLLEMDDPLSRLHALYDEMLALQIV